MGLFLGWRLLGPPPRPRFRVGQTHPWRIPARTVFVGDRELAVRLAGPPQGRALLLLHGLGGSSIVDWYEVGPRLADRYRLVMMDYRNHGLSARQVEPFDIDDLADDAAGVVEALGLGEVDVVGYSMGGAVAQALARRHPYLVRSLVLVATFAGRSGLDRLGLRVGTWLARGWERLTGVGAAEVRAGYLIAKGVVAPEYARFVWSETHRRDPEAGAVSTWSLLRFDSRDWAGNLDVPTLVVIPVEDQLVPARFQYELAAALPRVEVLELADARHEVPWTHAEEMTSAIVRFLEKDET